MGKQRGRKNPRGYEPRGFLLWQMLDSVTNHRFNGPINDRRKGTDTMRVNNRNSIGGFMVRTFIALGLSVLIVAGGVGAASGHTDHKPERLTQGAALAACHAGIASQLQHPHSAVYGVYTASHPTFDADWILTGNFTATASDGTTAVAHFKCNVQPFNGATVATITE